jgi:pimeloyl-ACP methyl ester carboxylesterase
MSEKTTGRISAETRAKLDANYHLRRSRMLTNGVELDVLEAGPEDGDLVILAHGFPEAAWSWRHQLKALGDAGYHAVAPDQRGYGRSFRPTEVERYASEHLGNDLLGIVDQLTGEGSEAVFVGHDWGAFVVWDLARSHPDRVRAVVNLSVPFVDWPAPPLSIFKMLHGDNFFYINYFQDIGVAEAEMDPQAEAVIRGILWSASFEGYPAHEMPTPRPAAETGFLDVMAPTPPDQSLSWCSEDDIAIYIDAFEASGFFGPVSWYRNLDRNAATVAEFPVSAMTMPTWFIGGTHDLVISRDETFEDRLKLVPGYRGMTSISEAGHWTQQERPAEVNAALLEFLTSL